MAQSRNKKRRRKLSSLSRKLRKQRTYNKRAKGFNAFFRSPIPPSPIPPPQAPSPLMPLPFLPIPPPQAPSLPKLPASNLPIPPPPNPLFIEPSPNHFIIRSQSPPYGSQKKPKAKQPKSEQPKLVIEPKPALAPEEPKQRRSLRQLIIRSDQTNTKVKRK